MNADELKRQEVDAMAMRAADQISEHADCVLILVSVKEGDSYVMMDRGRGNFWARTGMAQEFLDRAAAQITANELGQVISPPDEGESWQEGAKP